MAHPSPSTPYRGPSGKRACRAAKQTWQSSISADEWHPSDLGELLETVSPNDVDLSSKDGDTPRITGLRNIASFNWLVGEQVPTICVPGAPARWTPPSGSAPSLREDSGAFYRDINAAMNPDFPLQAAVRAVLAEADSIDLRTTQIFACASTLTSLYRFITGETKTFRFGAEVIGDAVFFVRQEQSPRQVIRGVHGYGHAMRDAFTTWHADMKGSISPQRIIRYELAGLQLLVRYEPDGYLPNEAPNIGMSSLQTRPHLHSKGDVDVLTASFDSAIHRASPLRVPAQATALQVSRAGVALPQSAVFDLKTRTIRKLGQDLYEEFDISIWLKQVPWMIQAYHTRGHFAAENIYTVDMRPRVAEWEKANAHRIMQFVRTLEKIINVAKQQPDKRLDVFRCADGALEIRKGNPAFRGALPAEDKDKWLAAA